MKAKIEYKSYVIELGTMTIVYLKEDGTYSESLLPCDYTSLEQAQEKLEKNSFIKEFVPAKKKELDMGGYYDILPEDIQNFEDILSRAKFKSKKRREKYDPAIDPAIKQLKNLSDE